MQTNKTLTMAFAFASSSRFRRDSDSRRNIRMILDPINSAATHVAR
jgi:hypothetical protein